MAAKVTFVILRLILGAVFLGAGFIKIWDLHPLLAAMDAALHALLQLDWPKVAAAIASLSWPAWGTPVFYEAIANYHILENSDAVMLSAVYLPWLEVVIGGALLLGRATAGAAMICAGLMLVFIAALASAWSRGLDISCGCFGRENATANFPLHLALDCTLLLCAVAVAWRERPRREIPQAELPLNV